jgi:prolyl-tRNA editing enzyme YbaK/EbsC (Cys-tRNA(Pro) deacylase)
MSKSLKRVRSHLADLGLKIDILEVTVPTNTAAQAAAALGCKVDQIVKSVIFLGLESGETVLFLTSGSQRVDVEQATLLAAEPLGKVDAAIIRTQTGFAIGGVSPFGHLNPIRAFFDPHLLAFDVIWAAAGTPRHMFDIAPMLLVEKTGATVAPFTDPLTK